MKNIHPPPPFVTSIIRLDMIINFMDYDFLICDVEHRNQLFFDILRGKYLNSKNTMMLLLSFVRCR